MSNFKQNNSMLSNIEAMKELMDAFGMDLDVIVDVLKMLGDCIYTDPNTKKETMGKLVLEFTYPDTPEITFVPTKGKPITLDIWQAYLYCMKD